MLLYMSVTMQLLMYKSFIAVNCVLIYICLKCGINNVLYRGCCKLCNVEVVLLTVQIYCKCFTRLGANCTQHAVFIEDTVHPDFTMHPDYM